MGRVIPALVAATATAALAGCGAERIDVSSLDLPFATYDAATSGGTAGPLVGELKLEAGCVLVREGDTAVVPVLGDGATWDAATSSAVLADGATLPVGHGSVELTGSLFDARPQGIAVPPSCPRVARYFVVTS